MEDIRALLIEDNEKFAKDIVSFLKEDIKVTRAISKTRALKLLNLSKYDLLLCDIDLSDGPSKNKYGIDVAMKFKKINPSSLIIGMSAEKENRKYWRGHCNYFWDKKTNPSTYKHISQYFR